MRTRWAALLGASLAVAWAPGLAQPSPAKDPPGRSSSPAVPAQRPTVGEVPAWVIPAAIPAAPSSTHGAATVELLLDSQLKLSGSGDSSYYDYAYRIDTAKGLSGNSIQVSWDPDLETINFHRIRLLRDGKPIDLLGDGSGLTVVRRETNLEQAALDGQLTATLQPEDLRVGDIVEVAYTRFRRDPAMGGHSSIIIGPADGESYGRYRVRMLWPASKKVTWRALPGAVQPATRKLGDQTELLFDATNLTTKQPPDSAPSRFRAVNSVDVSDFPDWASVAANMEPYYRKAATLAPESALRTEAARIAAATSDSRGRAALALQLVEDKVRYLLLSMQDGGYVPASADQTWGRRFGDCKAKTVLLIALLRELGIEARPVLVSTDSGDFLGARLPSMNAFDHVIAEARIGGRSYWLDGTRLGDRSLDRLETPNYRLGLPILAAGAALVPILPDQLREPSELVSLALDASGGLDVPAKATGEMLFRGDTAVNMRLKYAELSESDRQQELRKLWRKSYDFVSPDTVTAGDDPATGNYRLTMAGTANMRWIEESGTRWYEVDGARVGWKFETARDGQLNPAAPFVFDFPDWWAKRETIRLPDGGKGFRLQGGALDEQVNGLFAFHRAVSIDGDTMTMESSTKALANELPAAKVEATRARMLELSETGIYVRVPEDYAATDGDIGALASDKPAQAKAYMRRGGIRYDLGNLSGSEADEDAALALDPSLSAAHAIRASILAARKDPAADAEADRALALDAKMWLGWNAKGVLALYTARMGDAQADFDKALAIDPKVAQALLGRASARLGLENFAGALADADAVAAIDPVQPFHAIRGAALAGLFRFDESGTELDQAVKNDADDGALRTLRARVRLASGRVADARADYDLLIAKKPTASLYLARAATWPRAEQARALSDANAALGLDPKSTEALATRAQLEIAGAAFDKAEADIAAVEKIAPKSRTGPSLRLSLAQKRKDSAEAIRIADAIVVKYADSTAYNERCWTKATLGVSLDTALTDCEKSLALAPGRAAVLDSRAFVKLRSGQIDGSIADYDLALNASPSSSASLFGRAVARAKKGDRAGAEADLAAARRLDPDIDSRFADYGVTPDGITAR